MTSSCDGLLTLISTPIKPACCERLLLLYKAYSTRCTLQARMLGRKLTVPSFHLENESGSVRDQQHSQCLLDVWTDRTYFLCLCYCIHPRCRLLSAPGYWGCLKKLEEYGLSLGHSQVILLSNSIFSVWLLCSHLPKLISTEVNNWGLITITICLAETFPIGCPNQPNKGKEPGK